MGSGLKEAPVVELRDAFEKDYFVGPPPGASTEQAVVPAERPNPWRSGNPRGRPRTRPSMPDLNHEELQTNSSNGGGSMEDPVDYTPNHPSQIPSPKTRQTPRRPTRRSHQSMISDIPAAPTSSSSTTTPLVPTLDPPRLRPALMNELQGPRVYVRRNYAVRPPFVTQPSILRQPSITRPPDNLGYSVLDWNQALAQPRFAGAPNFTTFGNGAPRATIPADWQQQQYLNPNQNPRMLAPRSGVTSTVPPRAHSANMQPMQRQNARLGPFVRPQNNQVPGNFVPNAQPVRSAYDDFLKHISNAIPGVDINRILSQLTENPPQSIEIPVPGGFDANLMQNQLQSALEQIMTQGSTNPNGVSNLTIPNQEASASILNNLLNKVNGVPAQPPPPPPTEEDYAGQDREADAHNDEDYHDVETYADYKPAKLTFGQPHPDPVVETSSLSTVEPPDIVYSLHLPERVINRSLLSALQLESVLYACQQHSEFLPDGKTRKGFLIGDGAGVGKGRTVAGIIYENYLCGRKKSIWFSVSTDLKLDAERDLKDIGAKIPVHLLGKFPYGKRINEETGVIFSTYSGLVSKSQSIKGNLGSRIGQLAAWAGINFDGVIVFDECHKAKNISINKNTKKQSKAAEYALEIQTRLPKARVVYASATGASETRHLGYMTRLGIWGLGTPYEHFSEFCDSIERRGVGAMELVAVDLKMRGSYIARQLSFKTTSFEIRTATLDDAFIGLYDDCVELWSKALRSFQEAEEYFCSDKKRLRTMWTSFWAAHQKFFKYLCIGAKVPSVVQMAEEALANDKCVVIGLQSTGEAKTLEALEDGDLNEFVSTARATFESLVENHFPAPFKAKRIKQTASSSSTCSDLDLERLAAVNRTQPPSVHSSSSSSEVDENWLKEDSVRFVVENGVVKPTLEPARTSTRQLRSSSGEGVSRATNPKVIEKNKKVLEELLKAKKISDKRSTRAVRAKLRASKKPGAKSRIKKLELDSDSVSETEVSSSRSSSNLLTSSSENQDNNSSDETFRESAESGDESSETLTDFDNSEDEVIGGKSKRKALHSDSDDSDVQITAVKPRRHHEVIMLSSDDDEEEDVVKNAQDGAPDPMVTHASRLAALRDEMFALIAEIGPRLPNNTLDDLIDRLGGPTKVAEMTGRKGRVVKDNFGEISYKQRNENEALEDMNIAEKSRFMGGEKYVAIISEAASSGISLQADKRVANQRRRVHITIELPWSADRAIQQFGRTHRSNQVSGPEYVFIITNLAGEQRFASAVARRLESLGALTHGDRRATTDSRDLSQFNIASKYSRYALERLKNVLRSGTLPSTIKPDYPLNKFFGDARRAYLDTGLAKATDNEFAIEANASQINHFLNRLLGMRVRIQNAIFKLFTDYTEQIIAQKKATGDYDAGILELNSESGRTECGEPENYWLKTQAGVIKCTLRNVRIDRGIDWDEASKLLALNECQEGDKRVGFYGVVNQITKAQQVFLVLRETSGPNMFRVYKPHIGKMPKSIHFDDMPESAVKLSLEEAEQVWMRIYEGTGRQCLHLVLFNSCKRNLARLKCDVGIRHRSYCILSGGILTVWPYLERTVPTATQRVRIVRLLLGDKNRVIGPIIPQDALPDVRRVLLQGQQTGVKF